MKHLALLLAIFVLAGTVNANCLTTNSIFCPPKTLTLLAISPPSNDYVVASIDTDKDVYSKGQNPEETITVNPQLTNLQPSFVGSATYSITLDGEVIDDSTTNFTAVTPISVNADSLGAGNHVFAIEITNVTTSGSEPPEGVIANNVDQKVITVKDSAKTATPELPKILVIFVALAVIGIIAVNKS